MLDIAMANQGIAEWLRTEPPVKELAKFLLDRFSDARGIFVVGGALRDRFLSPPRRAKNVDVVLGGIPRVGI